MTPLLCRKVAKGDTLLDALTATGWVKVQREMHVVLGLARGWSGNERDRESVGRV